TLLHTCLELATIRVPMPADSLAQLESLVSHARQALLPSLLADMTRLYLTVGDSEAGERLLSGLEAMIEDRAEQPELDRLLSVLTALYVDIDDEEAATDTFHTIVSDAWSVLDAARAIADAYGPESMSEVQEQLEATENSLGGADPASRCQALTELAQ